MNHEIDGQVNETIDTCVLELLLTARKGEINVQFNETTHNCISNWTHVTNGLNWMIILFGDN